MQDAWAIFAGVLLTHLILMNDQRCECQQDSRRRDRNEMFVGHGYLVYSRNGLNIAPEYCSPFTVTHCGFATISDLSEDRAPPDFYQPKRIGSETINSDCARRSTARSGIGRSHITAAVHANDHPIQDALIWRRSMGPGRVYEIANPLLMAHLEAFGLMFGATADQEGGKNGGADWF